MGTSLRGETKLASMGPLRTKIKTLLTVTKQEADKKENVADVCYFRHTLRSREHHQVL